MSIRLALASISVLFITACTAPKGKAPALPKFACLLAPSGSFQAGSVVRTIDAGSPAAASVSPDDLVVAYAPLGTSLRSEYGDFEQSVTSSANASLTAKMLQRIGIVADLSGNAAYSVVLSAKDNSDYTADDELRSKTFERMKSLGGSVHLEGASYYFVKEALGSQNISYVVKSNADVKGNAVVKADSSNLSANVKFIDATSSITAQKKELIACVVLEQIKVIKASNGQDLLNAVPVKSDSPVFGVVQGVSKTY
jgi:hypothetical protein